jgi:hypothetical protein
MQPQTQAQKSANAQELGRLRRGTQVDPTANSDFLELQALNISMKLLSYLFHIPNA